MPQISDYDKDEETGAGSPDMSGGTTAPSAPTPGGATQANPSPQKEETFTPWSRFTSANSEVANREAGKLQSSVQGDVNAAVKGREDASKAQQEGIGQNYQAWGAGGSQDQQQQQQQQPMGQPFGQLTNEALNAPKGSKDLEQQVGAEPWAKLLGQTGRADAEAKALGSTTGVQGLIQDRASQPLAQNGAFDAALESQAGAEGFGALNKQFGDGQLLKGLSDANTEAQGRWSKLTGDIDAAKKAKGEAQAPEEVAAAVDESPGAKDLHDLLYGADGKDFFSDMHQAGLSFSPADWGAIALGESGTDTPMPTEEFVNAATGSIAGQMKSSWPAGKFQLAWQRIASQYPPEALAALLKAFSADNKAMLQQYLTQMKNPGFMARNMRAWMEKAGFKQRGAKDNIHEVRSADAKGETFTDTHGQQRTTSDEQETARLRAYREGWGSKWDQQFADGNDEPSR